MIRRLQSNVFAALDNLRLAMGTFLGNPLRTLLTLLGIVIGVMINCVKPTTVMSSPTVIISASAMTPETTPTMMT